MASVCCWERQGNVWIFLPLPFVTVENWDGLWTAYNSGQRICAVPPSRMSEDVKRAVWEYFDRRVEL